MIITPETGQYISAVLQTLSVMFAIIVLHRTLFKNEDKDDDMYTHIGNNRRSYNVVYNSCNRLVFT